MTSHFGHYAAAGSILTIEWGGSQVERKLNGISCVNKYRVVHFMRHNCNSGFFCFMHFIFY